MRTIRIPSSDLSVSQYALGTMYFGSKVPETTALMLMDTYADLGGNFFDSANKYASWIEGCSGGESERVIGRWLSTHSRTDVVISTKVGFPYGKVPRTLRSDVIIAECEKSLQRLGTDYIDVYFAHTQDPSTPIEETLQAFETLRAQGKIRYAAASNYESWQMAEAELIANRNSLPRYVALQQRFSFLQPIMGADFGTQMVLTPEQQSFCKARNILIMGYSPLLGGLYEKPDMEIPVQYRSEHNVKRMELLARCASEWGCTPSQLVLGWMTALDPGVMPVVTASRREHLLSNLVELPEDKLRGFAEQVAAIDSFTIRYS